MDAWISDFLMQSPRFYISSVSWLCDKSHAGSASLLIKNLIVVEIFYNISEFYKITYICGLYDSNDAGSASLLRGNLINTASIPPMDAWIFMYFQNFIKISEILCIQYQLTLRQQPCLIVQFADGKLVQCRLPWLDHDLFYLLCQCKNKNEYTSKVYQITSLQ